MNCEHLYTNPCLQYNCDDYEILLPTNKRGQSSEKEEYDVFRLVIESRLKIERLISILAYSLG